ncbi:MAG: dihydrolipoamide acetyltransferase family protein [Saprospiraceae bacterium]|nr:dihydrolipoamide acetyltransferase family protein [Saprospiraceae bacterium]
MALVEIVMPKMGESIMEATILKWVKKVGDRIEMDEPILEIATDKVDSEVPSPVSGTLSEIRFQENDVVGIGTVIAVIATEGEVANPKPSPAVAEAPASGAASNGKAARVEETIPAAVVAELPVAESVGRVAAGSNRFYSPLVRTIAQKEQISAVELENISGSGMQGRVTKKDILAYVENRQVPVARTLEPVAVASPQPATATPTPAAVSLSGNVEIIEMDRMRKLIAEHMVMSKHTSPHVTSFVEVDVTNMVNWRNRIKVEFEKKYNEKITFTPIFVEAVARAIRDFPMVNISVDGTKLIVKKDINIGMAAALPSGNLIVPVIRNADQFNLVGLTKSVNDLAARARKGQLKPEEVQGGTFTLTNVGTFGNVMGTPIINQPQVAILATGAIKKKPAVVETEYGDLIAVRQMMFLSLSYDHRVVDGSLGGSFLRRVGDYLEAFDARREV